MQGGIAFHHGNLSANDRAIVETLFLDRAIEVRLAMLDPVHDTSPHLLPCIPLLDCQLQGLPVETEELRRVPLKGAM